MTILSTDMNAVCSVHIRGFGIVKELPPPSSTSPVIISSLIKRILAAWKVESFRRNYSPFHLHECSPRKVPLSTWLISYHELERSKAQIFSIYMLHRVLDNSSCDLIGKFFTTQQDRKVLHFSGPHITLRKSVVTRSILGFPECLI